MSYSVGDTVAVRRAFPPGHVRTPYFIRGKTGIVDQVVGAFCNPEELAYGHVDTEPLTLYRVRFNQLDLWVDYDGSSRDSLIVDIYENWLDAPRGDAP